MVETVTTIHENCGTGNNTADISSSSGEIISTIKMS